MLLTWQPVAGAEGYAIYRGAGGAPLQLLGMRTENFYRDSLLTAEQVYRYAVATFDAQEQPQIGLRSAEVTARPSQPPSVTAAYFFAPNHVAVQFDEPMHESVRQTALFRLNKIDEANYPQPESVVLSRSSSEVILSFSQTIFTPGSYQVRVVDAVDIDRVPIDTTQNRANFTVAPEQPRFYIVAAMLESPRQILLNFNMPVDAASIAPVTNFKVKNSGSAGPTSLAVVQAAVVENNANAVRLIIGQGALGPLGRNYVVEISGVRSASGIALRSGEGDAIGFAMARADLNRVLVYPNPFIASEHTIMTIAGLTPQAAVRILDVEGRVLATLEETDSNGGVDWDTRDAQRKFAPSGIYLCYVTSGTQTTVTKFVIVR
jgi:hypothetical protein